MTSGAAQRERLGDGDRTGRHRGRTASLERRRQPGRPAHRWSRVVVDADSGVSLDDVAAVSREVSEGLDAHDRS